MLLSNSASRMLTISSLSPEFERALTCLAGKCAAESVSLESLDKEFKRIFREFGSHLAVEATMGEKYVIEASVTASARSAADDNIGLRLWDSAICSREPGLHCGGLRR